jgi:uncharacterized protein YecE (DUF72 family)
MVQRIHIGTSGWSYKHWKNDFYPKEVKQKAWLSYYSQHFSCTEINGSFYRLPTEETVLAWKDAVPANFLFCPKFSRYLTHMKKLREPEEPLERFFTIFDGMKDQMGPVLLQLPPRLKFHYDVADTFFSLAQRNYRQYQFVCEVRHDSWLHDDALTLLAKYDVGLVISQSGNRFPYTEMITAKNIYIRFHGPAELYASSYSDEELHYFAGKFKKWVEEGHRVWAFFNNDIHGYAPKDALRLKQICKV